MAFCPFREKISVLRGKRLGRNYAKSICCKMAPLLLDNGIWDNALKKKQKPVIKNIDRRRSMFKRVLTATGIPDACEPALITALEMAKQSQGKLFILHVMEATYRHECGPQESVTDFKTGEAVAPTHEYKEAVKEEIDKKCEGALKPFGNYEINVVEGRPGIEVRRWARKVGADLVVLGPHTERPEEEKELVGAPRGNTIEDVIAFIPSPVMIVNSFIPKGKLDFKKILVCIDFSRSCDYACRFAINLARKYGAKLFLLHLLSVPPGGYSKSQLDKEITAGKEKLAEFCTIPQGVAYEYAVLEGTKPSSDILKMATERQADLVVMGSHVKEPGEKWYVGSAVEEVSAKCSCAVAVVTHPDAVLKGEG
jgi:nucleotide-binding universal stress UspA family protein